MELNTGITPHDDRPVGVHLSHSPAGGAEPIELEVLPDGPLDQEATAKLRAGAAFLLDSVPGVPDAALARMIGCCFFACAPVRRHRAVRVTLCQGAAPPSGVALVRPVFEVEHHNFGVAHVLHEDETLGLYMLKVAPGSAIPAHFHRVMQESELVLDAGLLQQGRPVRAGDAFHWPAGFVHEYRNPTETPKRILCIDRPKFIREDEVVVTGPAELSPAAPLRNYLD